MSVKRRDLIIIYSVSASQIVNAQCHASSAPKANENLARAKFCTEIAKAKNAPALGVRVNAMESSFQTTPYTRMVILLSFQ